MNSNPHILITGANGFLGRHLVARLIKTNAKVTEVFREISSEVYENRSLIVIDLNNRKQVKEAFSDLKPNYVIHLADLKNRGNLGSDFYDSYSDNVSISFNVIDACLRLDGFKKFIFLGSCDEYGAATTPFGEDHREIPISAYGISKLAVTKVLSGLYHSRQFPSLVLRPSVIYGPNQGVEMFLPALIQSLLSHKEFLMTEGDQYRDFIYVDDVVDAIMKAIFADDQLNGSVVNIGYGASIKVKEIAMLVANLIDPSACCYLKFGAVQYRLNEVMNYSVDVACAQKLLGWQPSTILEHGLLQTISKFKTQVK